MSKGTPKRGIRIDDELWNKAQEIAKENGDNLSFIIRDRLREYVEDGKEGGRPTVWWRAIDEAGIVLAETSDPADFAGLGLIGKPGVSVQRLYERRLEQWREATP